MNLIDEQPFDKETLTKYINQLWNISQGRPSKDTDPEAVIFFRKQLVTKHLLKISLENLSSAPDQPWYNEYIALLAIRIENPALRFIGKKCVEELVQWYNVNVDSDKRELAVLGMIQFMAPLELTVPFNQHLWHKTMRNDVRAVILNQYPSVNYTDKEISNFWLARQAQWRYKHKKIRVVFIVQSRITCDKFLPVYEAMKAREDITPFLFLHSDTKYKHSENSWNYFRNRYPDDVIYDNCTLPDLRQLNPDYVFLSNPYEYRRAFPSVRIEDIITFAKVCVISYGTTLAYSFINRLLDDFPKFYRNIYLLFCSGESVKVTLTERFSINAELNRQHFEFAGYPALKAYYGLEKTPSTKKRVLWTPRWTPGGHYEAITGGSHFLQYKDKFISLAKRYGDNAEFYFRPHMNLFRELVKSGDMTKEEVLAYKKNLKNANIVRHTNLSDMDKAVRNIDIFLADYSSMLIEFFLTGRPVIYCEYPKAVPLPEYKEMFAAMYIAHSWDDVQRRLDELVAGNDPLFEKRQEIAKKIYELHKDATENIVDRVVQDFKDNQSRD